MVIDKGSCISVIACVITMVIIMAVVGGVQAWVCLCGGMVVVIGGDGAVVVM
jgi:hypothetical protein